MSTTSKNTMMNNKSVTTKLNKSFENELQATPMMMKSLQLSQSCNIMGDGNEPI
jgi:hypothetical protein